MPPREPAGVVRYCGQTYTVAELPTSPKEAAARGSPLFVGTCRGCGNGSVFRLINAAKPVEIKGVCIKCQRAAVRNPAQRRADRQRLGLSDAGYGEAVARASSSKFKSVRVAWGDYQ